jgi:hypothetical protein
MSDLLEKSPVVDDLTTLEFNGEEEQACTHSMHNVQTAVHEGAAAWWQDYICHNCNQASRGYRCDKWVKFVSAVGAIYCTLCGSIGKPENLHFRPLSGSQ